jgi:hypothetical protein
MEGVCRGLLQDTVASEAESQSPGRRLQFCPEYQVQGNCVVISVSL